MLSLIIDDQAEAGGSDASTSFYRAVEEATRSDGTSSRMAFDCEGVNLSRVGTLELVSLCFARDNTVVYVVDMSGNITTRVAALKKLFECKSLEKVIHDSRMDCDALYHLYAITLKNVHDTSCFHQVITGNQSALNAVLEYYSLPANATRDKSVYKDNFRFWATRPLTPTMTTWASSDVDKLLMLADKQRSRIAPGLQTAKAQEMSTQFTTFASHMKLERGLECTVPIGRFIGTRGSNMKSLERSTGTLVYQDHQPKGFKTKWMVYYNNDSDLMKVKRAMVY